MEIILTAHIRYRIEKRKILLEEVNEAISFPDKVIKKHEKYYYQKKFKRGTIEVPCIRTERHIKVLTAYWL